MHREALHADKHQTQIVMASLLLFVSGLVSTAWGQWQLLWQEDLQGFSLGDLPAQDATWRQWAKTGLETVNTDVVTGESLSIVAGSTQPVPSWSSNYAFKTLESLGVNQGRVRLIFRMRHGFNDEYRGFVAGAGILSRAPNGIGGTKGWLFHMRLLDAPMSAQINGVGFTFPTGYAWHTYTIVLDFSDDSLMLSVDGSEFIGPIGFMGNYDWTPADLVSGADGGLGWYSSLYYTASGRSHTVLVDDISVEQEPSEAPPDGITIDGADMRSLVTGRNLFAPPNEDICWGHHIPTAGFDTFIATTELNRASALTVTLDEPGYLYAVPWLWDFGFLGHLGDLQNMHGWQWVQADGGDAVGMPAPFSPMPLYRRPLSAGVHSINVLEYWGQWVLMGFAADPAASGATYLPEVTLTDTTTDHHVVAPGVAVTISADETILGARLYRNGAMVQAISGASFTSPTLASRYVLAVDFTIGTRLMPLTVGLDHPSIGGWQPSEFYPIWSYGGGNYSPGYPLPNPAVAEELTILAQFEIGYNAWFTNPEQPGQKALIQALGGRQIPVLSGLVRWPMRDIEDYDTALYHIFYQLGRFAPYDLNVLGLYVEDEPPIARAPLMKLVEERFAVDYAGTGLHLLYCTYVHPDYWPTAHTTTGMLRAYPFYVHVRGDIPGIRSYIESSLLEGIENWRQHSPDRPLWLLLPNFSDGTWDAPTPAQLRLLGNLTLARGMQAIGYFGWANTTHAATYRFLGCADWPYVATDERYQVIAEINAIITALDLSHYRWIEEVPQTEDFDVQLLVHENGQRIAWITNWSWLETRTGTIALPEHDEPVTVNLEPGASVVIPCGHDCSNWSPADLNKDCRIDSTDLALMSQQWLVQGVPCGSDY